MSKTPRTDAARIEMIYDMIYHDDAPYFGLIARADKMEELETELTELKAQFAEYVQAEDAWRGDYTYNREHLKFTASKLREKAKQTLKL